MIASSINMHEKTLERLSAAAGTLNMSRREVIVRLLMRIMRDIDAFRLDYGAVRYQPDDHKGRWHCFAIKFNDDENEFFTDLRKLCKLSVSFMVAIAVNKYLDEMIGEVEEGVYNYNFFRDHHIEKEVIEGVLCWRLSWGNQKTPRDRHKEYK